jgi:hypothetical protein
MARGSAGFLPLASGGRTILAEAQGSYKGKKERSATRTNHSDVSKSRK